MHPSFRSNGTFIVVTMTSPSRLAWTKLVSNECHPCHPCHPCHSNTPSSGFKNIARRYVFNAWLIGRSWRRKYVRRCSICGVQTTPTRRLFLGLPWLTMAYRGLPWFIYWNVIRSPELCLLDGNNELRHYWQDLWSPCVWGMDFELKLGRGGRLSEVEGPGVVWAFVHNIQQVIRQNLVRYILAQQVD